MRIVRNIFLPLLFAISFLMFFSGVPVMADDVTSDLVSDTRDFVSELEQFREDNPVEPSPTPFEDYIPDANIDSMSVSDFHYRVIQILSFILLMVGISSGFLLCICVRGFMKHV